MTLCVIQSNVLIKYPRSFRFLVFIKQKQHTDSSEILVTKRIDYDQYKLNNSAPLQAALKLYAPVHAILSILKRDIGAAATRDNYGSLPLHIAAQLNMSVLVVVPIIEAYPKALDTENNANLTPRNIYVEDALSREAIMCPTSYWVEHVRKKMSHNKRGKKANFEGEFILAVDPTGCNDTKNMVCKVNVSFEPQRQLFEENIQVSGDDDWTQQSIKSMKKQINHIRRKIHDGKSWKEANKRLSKYNGSKQQIKSKKRSVSKYGKTGKQPKKENSEKEVEDTCCVLNTVHENCVTNEPSSKEQVYKNLKSDIFLSEFVESQVERKQKGTKFQRTSHPTLKYLEVEKIDMDCARHIQSGLEVNKTLPEKLIPVTRTHRNITSEALVSKVFKVKDQSSVTCKAKKSDDHSCEDIVYRLHNLCLSAENMEGILSRLHELCLTTINIKEKVKNEEGKDAEHDEETFLMGNTTNKMLKKKEKNASGKMYNSKVNHIYMEETERRYDKLRVARERVKTSLKLLKHLVEEE